MTQTSVQKQFDDETPDHTPEPKFAEQELSAPSWFSRTYQNDSPQDMADKYRNTAFEVPRAQPVMAENSAAYEAYRQRIEDRFASAKRMVEQNEQNAPPQQDNAFPQRPRALRATTKTAPKKQSRKSSPFSPVALSIFTLTAASIGGLGGYVAANPETAKGFATHGVAAIASLWATAPVAAETVINKKAIRMASLDVKDVSGPINSAIALDISALATDLETPLAFKISGLPPAAYLTKGQSISQGEWLLKASEISSAELVVPQSNAPELALEVAAVEADTGVLAAPAQGMKVALDLKAVPLPGVVEPPARIEATSADVKVLPANALPDQGFNKTQLAVPVPAPLQSLNPEAQALISKGDTLLASGDILSARQFYLKAFGMDAPQAAYGVGQTYDPLVYASNNIKALTPDPQKAAEWYGKAAAAGVEQATLAMSKLAGPVE
jgi:hypothetical protein